MEDLLGPAGKGPPYAALVAKLDAELKLISADDDDARRARLLQNRGVCYYELGMHRRAVQDLEAALKADPSLAAAGLHLAKALVALRQEAAAAARLAALLHSASLAATELTVAAEARGLLAALQAGGVPAGARLPIVRPAAAAAAAAPAPPPPPAAPARPPVQARGVQTEAPPAAAAPSAPAAPTPKQQQQPAAPAVAALDPALRLVAAGDAAAAVAAAVDLVNAERLAEAEALLDEILRRRPGLPAALAARGTALALAGRLAEAEADFAAAAAGAPRVADFRKRRGQALAALGRLGEAAAELRAAAGLAPRAAERGACLADAARVALRRRDYRAAEADARAALAAEAEAAAAGDAAEDAAEGAGGARAGGAQSTEALLAAALVSQGALDEGAALYRRLAAARPGDADLALALGTALKEAGAAAEAAAALSAAASAGRGGAAEPAALRALAALRQGLGDHAGGAAAAGAAAAAPAAALAARLEARVARAACLHALGRHGDAVAEYGAASAEGEAAAGGVPPEAVPFLCLAFYQKELALYAAARLDDDVRSYCLDADLHPEFKELWCKRAPPGGAFAAAYRPLMQPPLPAAAAPPPAPPPAAAVAALVAAADALGALVQYDHPGFLPNARQRRAAGLAALELAQALRAAAAARRARAPPPAVAAAGASAAARARCHALAERGAGAANGAAKARPPASHHPFGWRDAMDVIVRWRQAAEPGDPVLWVDALTAAEFAAGFGSHTPMVTGQTRCVRYASRAPAALALLKALVLGEGERASGLPLGGARGADNAAIPLSAAQRAALAAADTPEAAWAAVGADFWAAVPVARGGGAGAGGAPPLEGTRLTVVCLSRPPAPRPPGAPPPSGLDALQPPAGAAAAAPPAPRLRVGKAGGAAPAAPAGADGAAAGQPEEHEPQPDAYEFSIRTPVTPARWAAYDAELRAAFDRLLGALAGEGGDGAAGAGAGARGGGGGGGGGDGGGDGAGAGGGGGGGGKWAVDARAALRAAAEFVFYWYNFMPLARGSAACGLAALLGAALAAGAPLRRPPPRGRQPDWDAILGGDPRAFADGLLAWAAPPEARPGGGGEPWPCAPAGALPDVARTLGTLRARLEALNGPDAPRI